MAELTARDVATRPIRTVLTNPRSIGLVLVAVLVQLTTVLPIPFLIQRIFDQAIPNENRGQLIVLGVVVIGLFVLGAVSAVLLHERLTKLAESIGRELRERLAEKLHSLPVEELRRRGQDDLFDLMAHETNRLSNALTMILSKLTPSVILVAGLVVVLALTDWLLFLIAAAFAPLMIALNWTLIARIQSQQVELNQSRRDYNAGLVRTLRLMPLTRVTDGHETELGRLTGLIRTLEKRIVRHSVTSATYTFAQQSIVIMAALTTLIIGGLGVISGRISLGTLFSFYAAIALLRPALDQIVSSRPAIAAGRIAVERFDDLFADTVEHPYTGEAPIDFTGQLELRDVAFGYRSDRIVVGPVNFTIDPGRLTVITGPNGSGKSTLIDLFCGLYRPTTGSILADGVPYDDVDIRDIRRSTGVVFQDPYLIEGTIEENLRFGGVTAHTEDIDNACQLAAFDTIVDALPDGQHTVLGESAHTLSGGQAQRLAIARALVNRPSLLLLDEPTNHLDIRTLSNVITNVSQLDHAPAILIITHDQDVIAAADQVITLAHPDLRMVHDPVIEQRWTRA